MRKSRSIFIYSTVLYILIFFTCNCYSQNRNSIWCFGDSAGIDFRNTSNPVSINTSMDGRGSCVTMADSVGNLLFYANCTVYQTKIYDRTHNQMYSGISTNMIGGSLYNELIIISNPGTQNQYYLFMSVGGGLDGLYYCKIDMNGNGGLGEITEKNNQLNNFRNADCLSAIKHGNGRDWWVISKYSDTNAPTFNRFYVYLVTQDSIHTPIVQDFNNATDDDFQKLIFSPVGNKLMQINAIGFMCEYNFDRCTGIISNPHVIFPEQTSGFNRYFWEGAYSPNGNLFYVSTTGVFFSDNAYLIQYNLNAANVPASADTLDIFTGTIGTGAARLAPDNKIYFSRAYEDTSALSYPYTNSMRNTTNENLSVINNPNVYGAGCNYQPFSFYLGGKRTYYGLPNNPNYELGALAGSMCDSLSGVSELNGFHLSLNVYPNPSASGVFYFQFNDIREQVKELEITDVMGRLIPNPSPKEKGTVNLSGIASGIYFYKAKTKEGREFNGKLVKE